jgi:hypothetical protein
MGEFFLMFYKEKKKPVQYIFYFAQSAQLANGMCCASKATDRQAGGSRPVIRILGYPFKGRGEEVLWARVASLIDVTAVVHLAQFLGIGFANKIKR